MNIYSVLQFSLWWCSESCPKNWKRDLHCTHSFYTSSCTSIYWNVTL